MVNTTDPPERDDCSKHTYAKAMNRMQSVDVECPHRNLYEVRHLTGYDVNDLAKLLNTHLSQVSHWLGRAIIPQETCDHLAEVLRTLRFIDKSSGSANREALDTLTFDGLSAVELIASQKYSLVRELLGPGNGRIELATDASLWEHTVGEFKPLLIHPEADGFET